MPKGSGKMKRGKGMPLARIPRKFCPDFIPDEQFLTFSYADQINASAAANIYVYQWNVNSLFDPNRTATGAQPVGFDQWDGLYGKYTVYAAEFEYDIFARTSGGVVSVAAVCLPSGTAIADYYDAAAQRRAIIASTTFGARPAKVKGSVTVADIWGVDDIVVDSDDTFSATTSASPNSTTVLNVALATSGATDTITITGRIKYKARLWKPDTQTVSTAVALRSAARAAIVPAAQAAGPMARLEDLALLLRAMASPTPQPDSLTTKQ